MPADSTPPVIIRPIPRRPFNLNFTSATPPDEDSSPSPGPRRPADDGSLSPLHARDHTRPQFLRSSGPSNVPSEPGSASISRAQSIMNLTSSTLFGIYSPTTTGPGPGGGFGSSYTYNDRDESGTPWGAGAESPREHDPEERDRNEALDRLRERLGVPPKSHTRGPAAAATYAMPLSPALPPEPQAPAADAAVPTSRSGLVLSLAAKAVLLFALGVGYGMLVCRLQDEHGSGMHHEGRQSGGSFFPAKGSQDSRYVAFWGFSGVLLGSLLPWFDHFWDRTFGSDRQSAPGHAPGGAESDSNRPDTEWALVIRGVGAFAGIVFAIRKLPWTSTMQVSLTLALVNPFLWYLIDRSKSGFTLASAVGVVGTAVIAGVDPGMMPTPTGYSSGLAHDDGSGPSWAEPLGSHAAVETGIWMLSVLFCSCVCFGNIGRRLALSTSSPARGRWGGVK
ncbi:hypothetical protein RB594_001387 [Gaeumannomyces avenae]